ncbi:putative Pilus assembly protein TadC [Candidatus Nitrospira inopinata]|uniref:Putative Pilus assembly protein TadC n=2 Tax=Candidatus Nitrospira inopinata TaxID=1715989 RepID=A0A0S4KRM3_9BACT|nr:putative Pilus assembly protein TadC [Candidatus Nitrospira inopinata]
MMSSNPPAEWLIVGLALATVACWTGLMLIGQEAVRLRRWRRLLQTIRTPWNSIVHPPSWQVQLIQLIQRVGTAGLRWMSPIPAKWADLITRSGYRRPDATAILLGFKLLGVAIGLLISLIGLLLASLSADWNDEMLSLFALGGVLTPIGWFIPDWWLRYRANRRQQRLQRSIPDFLDLLLVTIEAGLPLSAALDRIARVLGLTHPELGQELRQLVFDLRTSRSRAAALRAFAARTQVDAIVSLASVLIQTERFGVSLARTLRLHAETLRRKQQLHAEELAGALPVKLLFPLIFFIFPAIFVVLLGPAVVQGIETLRSMLTP